MDGEPMPVDRRPARTWPAVVLLLGTVLAAPLSLPGCGDSGDGCTWSAQCVFDGATGVCEVTGYCSFYDASCGVGRRYGDHSGPYSGTCVEESWTDGGGPDT